MGSFLIEFSSNVDIGCCGVHGSSCDKTAFDEFVGVAAHDFAVFAGSWFAFVGVDDEVSGSK